MKKRNFVSLALILIASVFVTTACSEKAVIKMESRGMNELIKTDVKSGDGAVAKAGQTVIVHYTGWLPDGSSFDSSRERDQPGRRSILAALFGQGSSTARP